MTKASDLTVEEKLIALYDLQVIHSKIDEIKILRGELPMEVSDLEDELEGLNVRLVKLETEITDYQQFISNNNSSSEEATELIKKYEDQSKNVRNNREYEALTKEIELQRLEIQLLEKKNKDTKKKIKELDDYFKASKEKVAKKEADLIAKKEELETISAQTQKDEEDLVKKIEPQEKKIEDRMLAAYNRVRTSYKNGLAVVTIERDSCGGCFAKIPPQRQLEIRQRKRIIQCEHCGRILVDFETELVD